MMKNVLVIDDDLDLRETLRLLIENVLSLKCEAIGSLEEVKALKTRINQFAIVILDVNLGVNKPSGVDVYEWLKLHDFPGRVVFLTGHAKTHPEVKRAANSGVRIYEKPIAMDLVEQMIAA